jgi:hypothetical protein
MAVLRYNGPWDVRPLWGVDFPQGKSVVVDDPALVEKALRLDGFELIDEDMPEPEPEPAVFDDYVPEEPEAEPAPLDVPEVGAGTLPENWRELHHKTRMKLARELSGMDDIQTAEAADAVLEALTKAG